MLVILMLDPSVLDRIKSEIVPIISSRIEVRKAGSSWKAKCPFHDDKNPSFTVSERKKLWRCFTCNFGGDSVDFIQRFHGVSFKGALEILGVKVENSNPELTLRVLQSYEAIDAAESKLLEKLEKRLENLQWLSRQLNQLINVLPPLERPASLYSSELWLDQEFEVIEDEREKIEEIARKHRREVAEWAYQQSGK